MIFIAILTFVFAMNVLAFGLYALDKHQAHYGLWRIPEAALLSTAVLSGAYGAGMAMLLFRHKTRHTAFLITVPLCFVVWTILLSILCLLISHSL